MLIFSPSGLTEGSTTLIFSAYRYRVAHFSPTDSSQASLLPVPTISVFEDDSQSVAAHQLVVVNNPKGLHLGVHVAALFHAAERMTRGDVIFDLLLGPICFLSEQPLSWEKRRRLTWCLTAGRWGSGGSAGPTEPPSSHSVLDMWSWLPWSAWPPWFCYECS